MSDEVIFSLANNMHVNCMQYMYIRFTQMIHMCNAAVTATIIVHVYVITA